MKRFKINVRETPRSAIRTFFVEAEDSAEATQKVRKIIGREKGKPIEAIWIIEEEKKYV